MEKIKSKAKPKIVVILGPTASGKSDLAVKIARKFNGEIISADSRQVYRGMDIGTGKITKNEQGSVKHHLIDVTSPKKIFTASDFKRLGEKAIGEIISEDMIPIIAGGTGFYIDVLLGRLVLTEVPPNEKLRARLEKQSTEKLFSKLLALDHRRAETIDRHNKRRLIRALEIIVSGVKLSEPKQGDSYKILWLGLNPRNIERRIKKRLDARLKKGMLGEVKKLLKQRVGSKRLDDFGLEYRYLSRYLKSEISNNKNFKKTEYYDKLLREIIKYSKRQMTWFKKNKDINWIKNEKEAIKLTEEFISE